MLDRLCLHFLTKRSILRQGGPHYLIVCLRRLHFADLQVARDDWNRAGAILFDVKKSLAGAEKAFDLGWIGLQQSISN